ncbi:helix-turn-helix domain-containing protein [Streptomyces sp. NPDC058220]|uniref:helix-turn-helix domain-containing protein n=1 Tax=Streptomyces sp. NPDC058220 TaxID=3346387 RepID=UPI0036E4867B
MTTTITQPGEPFVDALKAALLELIPQIPLQPDPELRLYTPAEAAALLGVSENWVTERVKARRVPCTFVGRFPRFAARHIRAIQDEGEIDPSAWGRRRAV